MKEHTVFLGGFSKAFAMTGWRVDMPRAQRNNRRDDQIHQYTMMWSYHVTNGGAGSIER